MDRSASRRVEKAEEAYRSIGEAADELDLQPHVLRYWEGKFKKHIRPLKRRDGRRMFRPEDMKALRAVQLLVHERGMTLKGASRLLEEQGVESVLRGEARLVAEVSVSPSGRSDQVASPARELQETVRTAFAPRVPEAVASGTETRLRQVLDDLNDVKQRLDLVLKRRLA